MTTPPRHHQRGITLVEALIGFLILCVSLVAALRLQAWLRLNGDIAHQRTEAVQLAQQDIEEMRSFIDTVAFARIQNQRRETRNAPTSFTLERHVSPDGELKTSLVQVSWADRNGNTQAVDLHASVVGLSPVYSAALALPPQDTALSTRHLLPVGAKHLGAGRSVFKPSAQSRVAWVIDNASGTVTAQCVVPSSLNTRDIVERDLTQCSVVAGALLRGYIRFSLGGIPNPAQANDTPLALSLEALTNAAGAEVHCETDSVGSATSSERYLAYACLAPQTRGEWGVLRIVPHGWAFGDSAATFKACRYLHSAAAVAPKNYLIVRGDAACPVADTTHNGVPVATVQHQP